MPFCICTAGGWLVHLSLNGYSNDVCFSRQLNYYHPHHISKSLSDSIWVDLSAPSRTKLDYTSSHNPWPQSWVLLKRPYWIWSLSFPCSGDHLHKVIEIQKYWLKVKVSKCTSNQYSSSYFCYRMGHYFSGFPGHILFIQVAWNSPCIIFLAFLAIFSLSKLPETHLKLFFAYRISKFQSRSEWYESIN